MSTECLHGVNYKEPCGHCKADEAKDIRIAELQSQLKEAKEGWSSAIADLYAAAEIAKGMQSRLDALTWTEITPEMKFDRSLDYLLGRPLRGCSVSRGDDFHRDCAGAHLKRVGWTHFRQINPPPPAGAKGETKP